MSNQKRWPRICTEYVDGRPTVLVQWEDGADVASYCGDTWCTGGCGLPALVIPTPNSWGLELKAHSSAVAFGRVMAPWRVTAWSGEKANVPEAYREELMQRWWI